MEQKRDAEGHPTRDAEALKELIRKHDYRFEDESHGEEMTSWRRAAEVWAGNPGVR